MTRIGRVVPASENERLHPASGSDYLNRLESAVNALKAAQRALHRAWEQRNDARYGRPSLRAGELLLGQKGSAEEIATAEREVVAARQTWLAAHKRVREFIDLNMSVYGEVVLRCGISDWIGTWSSRHCTHDAGHEGKHSFEDLELERRK